MTGSFLRSVLSQTSSGDAKGRDMDKKMSVNNEKSVMSELWNSMSKIGLMNNSNVVKCDAAPLPPSLPPPPGGSVEENDIAKAAAAVSPIGSPGPYEQATMDSKRLVSLDTADGARFDISKQLSPYMLVAHSFWLGTSMLPEGRNKTYTFVTQVATEDGKMLMARFDPEKRSLDGRLHYFPLGTRVQLSISPEGTNDQMLAELDLGSDQTTWAGNFKYGSMGGGIALGANYYQAITSRLAMGGEGMYLSANKSLMSNYTARYHFTPHDDPSNTDSSTIVGQWNPSQQMLSLNYKRTVTPGRVHVGAELQCNPLAPDQSQMALGAEFNLTRSKFNFCVGGDGRIQTVLEAKLGMAPGSPTLNFSANIHHATSDMKFGYGLNIGG
uniref:Mitochondrial import receptor subunit TOM40 homolog n=1 Tax=Eucampia antarctica TaxID=49252 RepID=A0A7S2S232_9STRA|mmetsp:Transcript_29899/g.28779  ORF Transcript_29899/g.28779 Transcript_29899/m.28779 type:complete len:383 (+) Transcript_29899:250-1398(+)